MEPEPDRPGPLKAKEFVTKAEMEREKFRFSLAFWLVFSLMASILIHYATVLVLELSDKSKAVEGLTQIFHSWLPVISGFVGSAVGYYFAKHGTVK